MSDTGTPPVIPTQFQQYNSYAEDPKWQRKFSMIWASAIAVAVLFTLPQLIWSIRRGRAFTGLTGIWEDWSGKHYQALTSKENAEVAESGGGRKRRVAAILRSVGAVVYWTPPGIDLNAGQILVILGYLVIVLVCVIRDAPLMDNPNRAGFMALAQLPVVFLFATKNSVLSLLLGPGHGYEKLNYIHRWSSRCLFLGAAVHGCLWINNHLQYGLTILGNKKEQTGVATFGLLCVIVLTSLAPVRKYCYQVFWTIHLLAFPAFFIMVCYHTIYATPWIFPPLAFYGLDVLMRLFRFRIKDATLTPIDKFMTIIHVGDCDGGWVAGQHVLLRVFFSGRVFESHPLTIMSAPPSISCLSPPGLVLGARVMGDWTRALNTYAMQEIENISCEKPISGGGVQVQVMLDGAYGGCSVDLGRYESVLLIAGGSGATFTLGLLDDIIGRCVRLGRRGGEVTNKIEFAWCVKSFGSIEWFASQLMEIATMAAGSSVDLHLSIYVTCLCDPEAVPRIPNLDVLIHRPSVTDILRDLVAPPSRSRSSRSIDVEDSAEDGKGNDEEKADGSIRSWVPAGGGVAVCASGPCSLTREAQNAVARLSASRGVELGGIALHTELFSL